MHGLPRKVSDVLYEHDFDIFVRLTKKHICCSDYGGWPEPGSGVLPIGFLPKLDRQAMIELCSKETSPPLPNVPTVCSTIVDQNGWRGINSLSGATVETSK